VMGAVGGVASAGTMAGGGATRMIMK
jgi:hypothetical protein